MAWDQAAAEAPERAPRADVNAADVHPHAFAVGMDVELDVVHADDLSPLDVDDLLIEQIALEQEQAVGR